MPRALVAYLSVLRVSSYHLLLGETLAIMTYVHSLKLLELQSFRLSFLTTCLVGGCTVQLLPPNASLSNRVSLEFL